MYSYSIHTVQYSWVIKTCSMTTFFFTKVKLIIVIIVNATNMTVGLQSNYCKIRLSCVYFIARKMSELLHLLYYTVCHTIRIRPKGRQRSSLLVGGRRELECRTSRSKDDCGRNFFERTSLLKGWSFGVVKPARSWFFPKHPFRQVTVLLLILFFRSSWY